MSRTRKLLFMFVLLAGLALVASCREETQPTPPPGQTPQVITVESTPSGNGGPARAVSSSGSEPLVLKTYSLPEAQAQRAASVLRGVLEGWPQGEGQVGRVSQAPGGQLVVLAPASMHEGIEALVAQLGQATGGEATAPPTVSMTYWLVAAEQGSGGGIEGQLEPIAATLQQVAGTLPGPVDFELLEKVTLVSDEGEHASIAGREATIQQSVWRRDGNTQAEIEVGLVRGPRIETRVRVRDGQTLVLGQVGLDPRVRTAHAPTPPAAAEIEGAPAAAPSIQTVTRELTLLYIVQARVLDEGVAVAP